MRVNRSILVLIASISFCSVALADDWIAERLRGGVQQYEGGNWVVLERGDIVPDGGKVRTTGTGRVDLVRGQESIALGPNTQIAVRDAAGQKMTSVIQSSGVVTVTAEKRNVQHFSVQTPVLAAVVKGTQFTVTYRNGQARVDVSSGVVQVQDSVHDMVVDVQRGQSAAASQATPLDISGPGADKAVFLIEGEPVPAVARAAVLNGDLPAAAAVQTVNSGGVSSNNSGGKGLALGVNGGLGLGQGGNPNSNEGGAAVGLGNGNGLGIGVGVGNGNSNKGGNGVAIGVGVGNGNSNKGGNGGVSASVGVGNGGASASAGAGNANANASVGGGNGVSVNVGVGNSGNGNGHGQGGNGQGNNGNGNGNGGSVDVDVDLGVVDVEVSVGGGNGLGLGLLRN